MFAQKKPEHKHTFRKAYKYDDGQPSNPLYTKGPRWLLMWACTGCPYRTTYDMTHVRPGKKND